MAIRDVSGDVVVAAAQVLNEGKTGGEDPGGPVTLQSAHRPKPGLQPSMIRFDRVVCILLDDVQSRRGQLVEDPRINVRAVGVTSNGIVPARSARVGNRRAATRSRLVDSRTSMTWPY